MPLVDKNFHLNPGASEQHTELQGLGSTVAQQQCRISDRQWALYTWRPVIHGSAMSRIARTCVFQRKHSTTRTLRAWCAANSTAIGALNKYGRVSGTERRSTKQSLCSLVCAMKCFAVHSVGAHLIVLQKLQTRKASNQQ